VPAPTGAVTRTVIEYPGLVFDIPCVPCWFVI